MNLLRSVSVVREEILWIAASLERIDVIKNQLHDQIILQ